MTKLVSRIKSEKAFISGIPVPMHYVLLFLTVVAILYGLRSWINRDKWETLVHEQYKFSVDYPANWIHVIYGERGSKNLHDLKAKMYTNSLGFLGPRSKSLFVSWISMEEPTLEQAAEWGLEKLARFEGAISDLQETRIGVGNYPTITRTFQYANTSEVKIHYYVIRDKGAYILEFYLRNDKDEANAVPIFDQMLASFQMND